MINWISKWKKDLHNVRRLRQTIFWNHTHLIRVKTVQVMIKRINGVLFCAFYSIINILIFLLHTKFSLGGNADNYFTTFKSQIQSKYFLIQVTFWKNENNKKAMF